MGIFGASVYVERGEGGNPQTLFNKKSANPNFLCKIYVPKKPTGQIHRGFRERKNRGTGSDGKKGEGRGVSPSLWESQSFFSALQFLNRVYGILKKRIAGNVWYM